MSGMDFAIKNAGKPFIIDGRNLPYDMTAGYPDDYNWYCHLVGYFAPGEDKIIVEFDDANARKFCWWIHDGAQLVVDKKDFYDSKEPRGFAIHHKHLKDLEQYSKYYNDEPNAKAGPIPQLYTSRCKRCEQPARKYGNLTVCSNTGCGTRDKLKKSLNIKYIKTNPIRCPNGMCGKRAVYVTRYSNQSGVWKLMCEKGHSFHLDSTQIKVNDTVLFTVSGHDNSDRIWDGKSWQTY